jgi:hypothetical protein
MADSRARNDHTSDSRATSAIVCVCTTRLPLKMQARPATSGLKDAPSRELYGVQAAEACGCGSHLSDEPSVRKAARCSVTQGRVRGRDASRAVCSWGGNQPPFHRFFCTLALRGKENRDAKPATYEVSLCALASLPTPSLSSRILPTLVRRQCTTLV